MQSTNMLSTKRLEKKCLGRRVQDLNQWGEGRKGSLGRGTEEGNIIGM